MKKYSKLLKEENALSNLTDINLIDKIVDFIRSNPFPTDHSQFHKWCEEQGYKEASEVEEYVYAILTVIFCGGASKGKEIEASDENISIGRKIELEHVSYDTDNPVILRIQNILKNKIANDHLAETNTYYTSGVNFIDELNKEGK